jgi:hypothetical protein
VSAGKARCSAGHGKACLLCGLAGQAADDRVEAVVEVPVGVAQEKHGTQSAEVVEVVDGEPVEDPFAAIQAVAGGTVPEYTRMLRAYYRR